MMASEEVLSAVLVTVVQTDRLPKRNFRSSLIFFSKRRNPIAYLVLKVGVFGGNIFLIYLLSQSP